VAALAARARSGATRSGELWREIAHDDFHAGFHGSDRRWSQRRHLHALFEYLHLIRDSESTVLLTAESGTGKEVTARHDAGRRKHRPLLAVSCALFSDTLIESELFGHERGLHRRRVHDPGSPVFPLHD
jgi:DNA-binding NtrC family response regulator